MKRQAMTAEECNALAAALRMNAKYGEPIGMDPRDTTFDGVVELDERTVEEAVVNAIRSVPTHY